VFVKIDADKHPENAQDVYFNAETKGQFNENEVDGERRANTGGKVGRKDALNRALRRDDVEYFSKNSAE